MAIAFRAAGAVAAAASGNVTPALPTGWADKDFAVCVIASLDNVNATMPAGWTAIDAGTNNGAGFRFTAFYRRLATGDTNPLVTHAAGSGISAAIACWSGVNQNVGIEVIGTTSVNASSTTGTATSITTLTDNDMVLMLIGVAAKLTLSGWSDSRTERVDGPNTNSRPEVGIAEGTDAVAGSTGAGTVTISGAGAVSNGILVALRPTLALVASSSGDATAGGAAALGLGISLASSGGATAAGAATPSKGLHWTAGENATDLLTSLVAYWNLTEASGTRADSHSSGLDLTDNNTVTQAAGGAPNGGNCAEFARANAEFLSRVNQALLQTGDIDFAISVWARWNGGSAEYAIISKDAAGQREYIVEIIAGALIAHSTTVDVLNSGAMPTNTWVHIIFEYDAATNTIYLTRDNGTPASLPCSGPIVAGTSSFQIGAREYVGSEDRWDGRIALAGFWKRRLTPTERGLLYNSGSGLTYAQLSPGTITPVTAGGAASVSKGLNATSAGGAAGSGSAAPSVGLNATSAGGAAGGGGASVNVGLSVSSGGTVTSAGGASVTLDLTAAGSGGATGAGGAGAVLGLTATSTGGATTGGAATVETVIGGTGPPAVEPAEELPVLTVEEWGGWLSSWQQEMLWRKKKREEEERRRKAAEEEMLLAATIASLED